MLDAPKVRTHFVRLGTKQQHNEYVKEAKRVNYTVVNDGFGTKILDPEDNNKDVVTMLNMGNCYSFRFNKEYWVEPEL